MVDIKGSGLEKMEQKVSISSVGVHKHNQTERLEPKVHIHRCESHTTMVLIYTVADTTGIKMAVLCNIYSEVPLQVTGTQFHTNIRSLLRDSLIQSTLYIIERVDCSYIPLHCRDTPIYTHIQKI